MTQDFAKPSTTRKPGAAKKKAPASKPKRAKAKSESKKASGASATPTEVAPSSKKGKAPLFISLFLLLAAFAYGIYFLQSIPPTVVDPATIEAAKTKPNKKSEQTIATEKEPETKRFNFYDILPESTVTPPKVEEYKYREKTQTGSYLYMIQTGSFKQKSDAERQKATIAMQGIKSKIKIVRNDSGTVWHRVETGPYNDRSKLNSALDKLVSINIQPLVKKVKKSD